MEVVVVAVVAVLGICMVDVSFRCIPPFEESLEDTVTDPFVDFFDFLVFIVVAVVLLFVVVGIVAVVMKGVVVEDFFHLLFPLCCIQRFEADAGRISVDTTSESSR